MVLGIHSDIPKVLICSLAFLQKALYPKYPERTYTKRIQMEALAQALANLTLELAASRKENEELRKLNEELRNSKPVQALEVVKTPRAKKDPNAPKDPRRVAAGLKAAETRRRNKALLDELKAAAEANEISD